MNTIHRLTSEGKSPYEVGNLVGISTAEALEAMKQAADETQMIAEMAGWDTHEEEVDMCVAQSERRIANGFERAKSWK